MGSRWLIAVILLLVLFLTGTLAPMPSLLLQLLGWALVAMLSVILLCVMPYSAWWPLLRMTPRGRRIAEARKLIATAKLHGRRGYRSPELEEALRAIQGHRFANRWGTTKPVGGSGPDSHRSMATGENKDTRIRRPRVLTRTVASRRGAWGIHRETGER
ncbi:MAG: hypothetical protein JJT90_10705 [Ectothiorhodospiraceae bacterium]|nr:hypothetical protein [Ectothiorhodospiraceae bacterium]